MAEKKVKKAPARKPRQPKKQKELTDMLAVIKLGGRQHLVKEGTELEVHRLDAKKGSKTKVEAAILRPKITKGSATYKILEHKRGPKIDVMTYKAKARYRRKKGFRADLSQVKVESISVGR